MLRVDRRRFLVRTVGALATSAAMWSRAQALSVPSTSRRLSLVNAHTGETFDGTYRDESGPIARVMDELSIFLRDHHSGAKLPIDVAVLDFVADVMAAVGQARATILSAYRTPETNAMLARTHFGVAENSQHLYGRALDIRLDARNEVAAQAARMLQRGGVGWYPHSGFFHIDAGPVRNWTLDEKGLDLLLVSRRHEMVTSARRNHLVLPGMELSGDPLPRLANSGRPLPWNRAVSPCRA
jgi:uncharacterized protein YcbK (DUF882 family)